MRRIPFSPKGPQFSRSMEGTDGSSELRQHQLCDNYTAIFSHVHFVSTITLLARLVLSQVSRSCNLMFYRCSRDPPSAPPRQPQSSPAAASTPHQSACPVLSTIPKVLDPTFHSTLLRGSSLSDTGVLWVQHSESLSKVVSNNNVATGFGLPFLIACTSPPLRKLPSLYLLFSDWQLHKNQ